jgi:carbamoyltransferase
MTDGILGLWDGHESGVALVADGVLAFALSEERPSRRKRASGFPACSLSACLDWAETNRVRIAEVAVAGAHGRLPLRCLERLYAASDPGRDPTSLASRGVAAWENTVPAVPLFRDAERAAGLAALRRRFGRLLPRGVPVTTVAHHDAHAATALLGRGPGTSLVLTWDAYGEGACATVRRSDRPDSVLASLRPDGAIAALYGAVAVAMGFREGDEGKVMGLAAAGRPEVAVGRFLDAWDDRDGAPRLRRRIDRTTVARLLRGLSREDAAAGLQAATAFLAVRFVARALAASPRPWRVLLAGGLFHNILVNQAIASIPGVEDAFVFPNMGDGGLCAGAAVAAWRRMTGALPEPIRHVFLGPEPSAASLRDAAARTGLPTRRSRDVATGAARHLRAGRVVCRYAGRDEFGPRALGNRSILFPADVPGLPDRVNAALRRDGFMPFGPAVAAGATAGLWRSPLPPSRLGYMTFAVDATDAFRACCPSAVHLDGTSRPQVADAATSPSFLRLLERYREHGGGPGVINTSFNLHGEPIVHSPRDAVATFLASGLDVLYLGEHEVRRPGPGSGA